MNWLITTRDHSTDEVRRHEMGQPRMVTGGVSGWSWSQSLRRDQAYYRADDETIVFFKGTCMYHGATGVDALARLYRDQGRLNATVIRANLRGHYAVCLATSTRYELFTDDQANMAIYYSGLADPGGFVASTDFTITARAVPRLDLNPIAVFGFALHHFPGRGTVAHNIRRLGANEVLVGRPNARIFQLERLPFEREPDPIPSLDDAISDGIDRARSFYSHLPDTGAVGVHLTAGMDSRTVLAGLLDTANDVTVMSGLGNSSLTKLRPADYEVAQRIASESGLAFHSMDFGGAHPHDHEHLTRDFRNLGFLYTVYGNPENLAKTLREAASKGIYLQTGGYGAVFTNAKPWEGGDPGEITLDDVASSSVTRAVRAAIQGVDQDVRSAWYSEYEKQVADGLDEYGMSPLIGEHGRSAFARCQLALVVQAQANVIRYFNEHAPYIAPYATSELASTFAGADPRLRNKDELQVQLVQALAPNLADFPLYSGVKAIRGSSKGLAGSRLRQRVPAFAKTAARFGRAMLRADYTELARLRRNRRVRRSAAAYVAEEGHRLLGFRIDTRTLSVSQLERLRRYIYGASVLVSEKR